MHGPSRTSSTSRNGRPCLHPEIRDSREPARGDGGGSVLTDLRCASEGALGGSPCAPRNGAQDRVHCARCRRIADRRLPCQRRRHSAGQPELVANPAGTWRSRPRSTRLLHGSKDERYEETVRLRPLRGLRRDRHRREERLASDSSAAKRPTWTKLERSASEVWLGGRDSNPDNGVQSAVSYR